MSAREVVYLHEGIVQGHCIYKRVWSPAIGEILKLTHVKGMSFSVCAMKGDTVGHVFQELLDA